MLWEPSSCCCFSLRTGSLILASLYVAGSILSLLSLGVKVGSVDLDQVIDETCHEGEDDPNFTPEECVALFKPMVIGLLSVRFVMESLNVIFSSMIIHGISKNKSRLMVPFMVYLLVCLVILVLAALGLLGLLMVLQLWQAVTPLALIMGVIVFLQTYFLLVIRAHYLQIKRAKGRIHMTLKEEHADSEKPFDPYSCPKSEKQYDQYN